MESVRDKVKNFQDLWVWHLSGALSLMIYQATDKFPKGELYGLTSQMRRAAVSTPTNIAEGFKKNNNKRPFSFSYHGGGINEEVKSLPCTSRGRAYISSQDFTRFSKEMLLCWHAIESIKIVT